MKYCSLGVENGSIVVNYSIDERVKVFFKDRCDFEELLRRSFKSHCNCILNFHAGFVGKLKFETLNTRGEN